jgi:hypothetical protein
MTSASPMPVLLSVLVGFLLGLVAWGAMHLRRPNDDGPTCCWVFECEDSFVLGMLGCRSPTWSAHSQI